MTELAYEASDEASENELLDKSLSVWRGWNSSILEDDFSPVKIDIHTASSIGQYESVKSLINKHDVDIDKRNRGGWTPLMYASYIGHDAIAKLLIDAECDLNMKNNKGQTPLMLAASCGNEGVGHILVKQEAEIESIDKKGWTALFHATNSGHQNFVRFLLSSGANMDAVVPSTGVTPLMEAAAEGHEIIVQLFLQYGVNVNVRSYNGDNARSVALINGYMKIVSLIDNHLMPISSLRIEQIDFSSSDEMIRRPRPQIIKGVGPSIRDGPDAIAKLIDRSKVNTNHIPTSCVPKGYVTFPQCLGDQGEDTQISYRDVTSPINPEDYTLDSSGGKEDSNAFSKTGAITIKSSSSSSGGLVAALGLSRDNSLESDDCPSKNKLDLKQTVNTQYSSVYGGNYSTNQTETNTGSIDDRTFPQFPGQQIIPPNYPHDLSTLLENHGLSKYLPIFEEQDVDLTVFLSLTDNDLKEIGIKLFGPRKKMTNAIARWHSNAPVSSTGPERVYADRLEGEMQEMAIQLSQAYNNVDKLKAQIQQEKQLRSVTESCLLDQQESWQNIHHTVIETKQHCDFMKDKLKKFK
ncbi:hypothetical protein LOTGIDRAFT_125983 [Lottia gigantea]|uniref:SAM domain-containing protein n=1 Tax=Lottia gigantea TaxID=225164 RepID=V4A0I4_LOTGI|nr:hypothetical protein LOTGIDRAFT_125983 [Lottia gigantea]ESO88400.1 hypothetical protein LOTGIDRAFT_125983 [Lottia gigantea]